ncbi:MAG: sensor histidine kinase [Gracilimonas sp.]|uniref:sensor histidine kinase n=1 Tax=Gracilimonas TaxID=649462 RepID=UPI001B1B5385|nr:sensor histidine kinase [Gracilimonas sp.]MBO6584789.1 sensor histidine kinase [Gracilimonas sp.]MBO6615940.1 sensor histidine kinase [Gracilimonas sp.]
MDWLLIAITILSLASSIVAWIAKIKWSNEFKEAKEAQITFLKEKVQHYKELSSNQLIEYFKQTKSEYEESFKELKLRLEKEKSKKLPPPAERSEEVQKLIQERTILFSEMNRRVKNNLAIVSGLLQLQSFDTENKEVQKQLEVAEKRISTIALVHEVLYETDSINEVDINVCIEAIAHMRSLELNLNLKENSNITLTVNQATPLLILLNELFSELFYLEVKFLNISLKRRNDQFSVILKNKDIPTLEDMNYLSQELIQAVTERLKGEIRNDANCLQITFPITTY